MILFFYQVNVVQLLSEISISLELVAPPHRLVVDAALLVDEVGLEVGQNNPERIVITISIGVIVFALAIISEMFVGENSMKKATMLCFISAIFSFRGAIMPLKKKCVYIK